MGIIIDRRKQTSARISNQYLLRQLAVIVRLGRADVSLQLVVEVWKTHKLVINDTFFMHFDVLSQYGFLEVTAENTVLPKPVFNWLQPGALEQQVSITQAGSDFLERYAQF